MHACFFIDIDTLITISGMVIRTSQIIPEMREGISVNIVTFASHSRNQTCHGAHLSSFVVKEQCGILA